MAKMKFSVNDKKMLYGVTKAMAGDAVSGSEIVTEGIKDDEGKSADGEIIVPKIKDFLATPSAQVLIPKVVVGTMREVAEPMYIGTKFFQKVNLPSGSTMTFPSIGTVARAHDIAEGQEYPEETLNWQTHESTDIRVGKVGLRLAVTDEMISDCQWDVISMLVKAAGRAMIRHKENKAFNALVKHGHCILDNSIKDPRLHTTGIGADGNFNNTLSAEDLLDIIIGVMSNEFDPTDLLMHPLVWTVFARSELTGGLSINNSMGGVMNAKEYPKGGSFALGPNSVQGRIPYQFNVNLSPFMPIDKVNKTFDIVCLDKDNVGVYLEKTKLSVEKFDNPAQDIQNMKFCERYNFGVLNEGRGVVTAKNISMEKSYPQAIRVKQI